MAVVIGRDHTLAVTEDGKLWAWGRGIEGQLGLAHRQNMPTPTSVGSVVMSVVRFAMVAAGKWSSAALAEDGTVWTWGYSPLKMSVDPTRRDKSAFGGSPAMMITCGELHTMVLAADGRLWTFGIGTNGQLGLGIAVGDKSAPTLVLRFSHDLETKIVMVAAGAFHSMALTANGDVYTWGSTKHGVLGHHNGDHENDPFRQSKSVPFKIDRACFAGSSVIMIAAGDRHSAAVTEEGKLFMWGSGAYGKLGLGDNETKEFPTSLSLNLFGKSPVRMVTCSDNHTMAVTEEGSLWSWGASFPIYYKNASFFPTRVDPRHFDGAKIVTAAAGLFISIAVTEDGILYSWGYSNDVMSPCLGHGDSDHHKPVPMRLSPHFMHNARIGRYHKIPALHAVAFAMGMHSRLGSGQPRRSKRIQGKPVDANKPQGPSLVNQLDCCLVKMILDASRSWPNLDALRTPGLLRLMGN